MGWALAQAGLWAAINASVFESSIRAEVPALVRIAASLVILVSFIHRLKDTWLFITPDGVLPLEDYRNAVAKFPQLTFGVERIQSRVGLASVVFAFYLSGLFSLVGLFTTVSLIMFFVTMTALQSRSFTAMFSGGDSIARVLLLMLAFSRCSEAWSIDCVIDPSRDLLVPAWPMILLQIYVAILYFQSAIHKSRCESWLSGEAIRYTFLSPMWRRRDLSQICKMRRLCRVVTYLTMLYEYLFPIALIFPETQTAWMLAGFGLHGGIWLLLRIGYFAPLMIVALLSFSNHAIHWLRLSASD